MRAVPALLLVLSCLLVLPPSPGRAASAVSGAAEPEASLEFLVMLPGRADRNQLASGTEGLARWLGKRLGLPVRGRVCADPDEAKAALAQDHPAFALVDLGFYVDQARAQGLRPVASARPGGFDADLWRLLVPADAASGRLAGDVEGTVLFSPRAAACLVLPGVHGDIVRLVGVTHPAEAVRRAAAGEISGVVLDRIQFDAARAMPGFDKLAVKHATGNLPTPPVVWLGDGGELADRVAKALQAMGSDPAARQVLRQLELGGFGPPDPGLGALARGCLE
ncbi:MAG: hypothetical protein AB7D57_07615 [Desulfovibrionaceae bacterium]